MREELILETAEQIRALAHPLRQRILNHLGTKAYTNKQLAVLLNESPARLHFHVRELLNAGLIELVEERPRGGVLEKYYQASARIIRLSPETHQAQRHEGLLESSLDAARQEYARAAAHFGTRPPDLRFTHFPVWLSSERLQRIQQHLDAINEETRQAEAAGEAEPHEHHVMLTYLLHTLPPEPQ